MHRLFVAVDLPDDVRNAVSGICSGIAGARWVPAEQLHLTLRFIGEVDDAAFGAIRRELAGVKEKCFTMGVEGVGHFPPGKHPRVLWVGLDATPCLLSLQEKVERAVVAAGASPEDRRFSPHITLARLKDPVPGKVEEFETRYRGFSAGPFPVSEYYLYSSTLTGNGAIHRREAVYPLA